MQPIGCLFKRQVRAPRFRDRRPSCHSRQPHGQPSGIRKPQAPANVDLDFRSDYRPAGDDREVAAIAVADRCVVVTENEKDFADVELINPLRGATSP